jgi:pimeloyl-ACP methyl ester carboxylesterase
MSRLQTASLQRARSADRARSASKMKSGKLAGAARGARRRRGARGWRAALATLAALALLGTAAARAQDDRGQQHMLSTDDGWQLPITYYPAKGDKETVTREAPVVVLLHGDKENRLVWEGSRGLAVRLQDKGYAVITVDLRKHGQSTNAAGGEAARGRSRETGNLQASDYQAMVEQDLAAVKDFIYEQNQAKRLNMNKLGIIGAESSAIVAMAFAVVDWNRAPYDDAPSLEARTPRGQDVRALVLLSPPQKVKGISLGETLAAVRDPAKNIAILTLYGKRNKADAKDALYIHNKLFGPGKLNEDRIYLKGFDFNLRGTGLLGKKEVDAESTILAVLDAHLLALKDSPWRDRQSRLATNK